MNAETALNIDINTDHAIIPNTHFAEAANSPLVSDHHFSQLIAQLGFDAMVLEVSLTPKPGLVDSVSNGAHKDMNMSTFLLSAQAIRPFISQFFNAGLAHSHLSAAKLLPPLRKVGLQTESAMFNATNDVNTHKGMIFTLGLVCGAMGWLKGKHQPTSIDNISQTIKQMCAHLVNNELITQNSHLPKTYGESIFQQFGLTGARGEAASGLATIINYSLPEFKRCLSAGYSLQQALLQTLLVLYAHNQDTNLVSRGGMAGLEFVQHYAQKMLSDGGIMQKNAIEHLNEFDQILIDKNLSPGGSADLLAITWLLAQVSEIK